MQIFLLIIDILQTIGPFIPIVWRFLCWLDDSLMASSTAYLEDNGYMNNRTSSTGKR